MSDEKDGSDFNAENFHACFMAAAQAASRWSSLSLISPPPHGEYKALQILQPLVHLKSFRVACGFGGFLEPLMTAICKSASPNLSTMALADPVAIPYLVEPAGVHIAHSLTTLHIELPKRMAGPVDILPHLHKLVVFEARNLCLPFYPPDTSFPFIHTLRALRLKSVSVQWMAGRVFPVLETCGVIFPLRADISKPIEPVTMPSCAHFSYYSNDLHPLEQFQLPSLKALYVKCGQWGAWRRNPQLVANLSGLVLLHMEKWPSDGDLIPILRSLSLLDTLTICSQLDALSFRAFLPMDANATSGLKQASGEGRRLVLCPRLQCLRIEWKAHSMPPELIPILKDVVTLRADCGSPLESFTFAKVPSKRGREFELIGRDGSFIVEMIDLDEEADGVSSEEPSDESSDESSEQASGFKLDI